MTADSDDPEMTARIPPEAEILRLSPVRRAPPPVSVVIPAYNRETTIATAIRSVLSQSWGEMELLVVDDGSADGTIAVVEAIGDPRLTLLRHRGTQGPSGARNTGLRAAAAEIVAFQDSDDIWLPDKLAAQMACLEDPAVVASYCGMLVTGSPTGEGDPGTVSLAPRFGYASGDIAPALRQASLISTQTLAARRAALIAAGAFDPDLRALEDWDLAIRLCRLGPVQAVPEPLVVQRFSDNSLTRLSENWARAHAAVLRKHDAFFAAEPAKAARQWRMVAGRMARIGDWAAAEAAAREALRFARGDPRLWGHRLRAALRRKLG